MVVVVGAAHTLPWLPLFECFVWSIIPKERPAERRGEGGGPRVMDSGAHPLGANRLVNEGATNTNSSALPPPPLRTDGDGCFCLVNWKGEHGLVKQ